MTNQTTWQLAAWALCLTVFLAQCGDDSSDQGDTDFTSETGGDTDTDIDADTDVDADGDTDADVDTDTADLCSALSTIADYYVDSSISVSGDGLSEATAFKTIEEATALLLQGQTVLVMDGVGYIPTDISAPQDGKAAIRFSNSGTLTQPITVRNYPCHKPHIVGGFAAFNIQQDHIVVDGFEISGGSHGIYSKDGLVGIGPYWTGIVVQNNYIHDIDGSGLPGGIWPGSWLDGTIRNNIIHGVRINGTLALNSAAIFDYDIRNSIIENNLIFDAYDGIFHKQSDGAPGLTIRANIFHSLSGRAIRYQNAGGNDPPYIDEVITGNVFIDTSVTLKALDIPVQSYGSEISQNVFHGGGIHIAGFRDTHIWNNIFYESDQALAAEYREVGGTYWFSEITEANFNAYYNNIQLPSNTGLMRMNYWSGGPDNQYHTLIEWQAACSTGCPLPSLNINGGNPGASSISTDPIFVDPQNSDLNRRNYSLQVGSLAIGAGRSGEDLGVQPTGIEQVGPSNEILERWGF